MSGGQQPPLNLDFRGTFANSGGHTKSIRFLPVKLNTFSSRNFEKFLLVFYLILTSMAIVLAREGL